VLGFYLSSHPLAEHEEKLAQYCSHTTSDLSRMPDKAEVIVGGMLSAITLRHVKNARQGAPTKYANFDLEDKQGIVRCILWPDHYAACGDLVEADGILVVRGDVDRRGGGDEANLIVSELIPLGELESRYTSGIVVRWDERQHGTEKLEQIRQIVRTYPGACELRLLLCLEDGSRVHLKSHGVQVEVTLELRQRIDQLLGPGNLRLITNKPTVSNGNGKRGRRGRALQDA
jgi:DNA polymerase-3 subunit alpha